MVIIKIIPDIFSTEGREEFTFDLKKDKEYYLSDFFAEQRTIQHEGQVYRIEEFFDLWMDGIVVDPQDWEHVKITECSEMVFFLRPGPPAIGIAVVVAALAAKMAIGGIVGALVAMAITLLGTVAMMFLAPKPDVPSFGSSKGFGGNRAYAWGGVTTEYTSGSMVPIAYGRTVVGGKAISQRIASLDGKKQTLSTLLLVSEGPIRGLRKLDENGDEDGICPYSLIVKNESGGSNNITVEDVDDPVTGEWEEGIDIEFEIVDNAETTKSIHKASVTSANPATDIITFNPAIPGGHKVLANTTYAYGLPERPWIKVDGKFYHTLDKIGYSYRIGHADQPCIPLFNETYSTYSDGRQIGKGKPLKKSYTTTQVNNIIYSTEKHKGWTVIEGNTDEFEAAEFNILYPYGLYFLDKNSGDFEHVAAKIEILYKLKTQTWKQAFDNDQTATFKTKAKKTNGFARTYRIPQGSNQKTRGIQRDDGEELYFKKAQYDFALRRKEKPRNRTYKKSISTLQTYTRVIRDEFQYPGSALVAVRAKATDQLSSAQPDFEIKIDGRPLKYYDGNSWSAEEIWDTNNTDEGNVGRNWAWQMKDLAYNTRYGMGNYFEQDLLTDAVADKYKELADYCNEQVDIGLLGQAGQEARFRSDVIIDEGYFLDILQECCSSCASYPVIAGATVYPVVDKARSPILSLGMSQVIAEEGRSTLTESWSSLEQNYNQVKVQYWDEDSGQSSEMVEYPDDNDLIADRVRQKNIAFHNVTRRSHALRLAKRHFLAAKHMKHGISFTTTDEALALQPGDVFYFSHDIPQFDYSGDIFRVRSNTEIELDNFWAGVDPDSYSYKLLVRDRDDDTIDTVDVTDITTSSVSGAENRHIVTLPSGHSLFTPADGDPYILIETTSTPKKYICLELGRDEEMRRTISAIEYAEAIYDLDIEWEAPDYTDLLDPKSVPDAPTDLTLTPAAIEGGFYIAANLPIGKENFNYATIEISVDDDDDNTDDNYVEVWRGRTLNNYFYKIEMGRVYYVRVTTFSYSNAPCQNPAVDSVDMRADPTSRPPDVRSLYIKENPQGNEFRGKDCKVAWRIEAAYSGFGRQPLGQEPEGLSQSHATWSYKDTMIEVFDTNGNFRRREYKAHPEYSYSQERNIYDSADDVPLRSFVIKAWYRDIWNQVSQNPKTLSCTNSAPDASADTPYADGGGVSITIDWNSFIGDYDLNEVVAWDILVKDVTSTFPNYTDPHPVNHKVGSVAGHVSWYDYRLGVPGKYYAVALVPRDLFGQGTQTQSTAVQLESWTYDEVDTRLQLADSEIRTGFEDSSDERHEVTVSGNPQIENYPAEFNESGAFNTSGRNRDWLEIGDSNDWDFGTGDFTIDLWFYVDAEINDGGLISSHHTGNGWFIMYNNEGIEFETDHFTMTASGYENEFADESFHHLAVVRDGTDFTMYIDGEEKATEVSAQSIDSGNNGLVVSMEDVGNPQDQFRGWIDEVRISKGIARWTSDFSPPSNEYSPDSYTKLLLHMDTAAANTELPKLIEDKENDYQLDVTSGTDGWVQYRFGHEEIRSIVEFGYADDDLKCYVATSTDGTTWTYYKAQADHTLYSGSRLYEADDQGDARNNYWDTSNGTTAYLWPRVKHPYFRIYLHQPNSGTTTYSISQLDFKSAPAFESATYGRTIDEAASTVIASGTWTTLTSGTTEAISNQHGLVMGKVGEIDEDATIRLWDGSSSVDETTIASGYGGSVSYLQTDGGAMNWFLQASGTTSSGNAYNANIITITMRK